ncbi:MAG: NHL repeat-containing protein [Gemmatimonadales bacterium]
MSCARAGFRIFPWVILAALGCSRSEAGSETAWRAERTTTDGAEQVRTLSGSVWGGRAELVEELAFGVVEGAQVYMFGRVTHIAPDGRGGAYVFDSQVPVLRHYDSTGWHTRTIGRAGSGPGEYQDAVLGLSVLSDGRIVLLDPRNSRFNVYASDGTLLDHWPRASGLFTARAMYVDTADNVYTRVMTGQPQPGGPMPPIGLLRLSPTGQVLDTMLPPSIAGEPAGMGGLMAPIKIWDYHRDGYPIVGLSDRYLIELRKPEGTVRIEKAGERIAVRPEERAEREAIAAHLAGRHGGRGVAVPPMPSIKPFFRGIYAGDDGTIWVRLHREAVRQAKPLGGGTGPNAPPGMYWIEPTVFDVFESDGTYLGEVPVPSGMTLHTYSRDRLWATREGEQGEILVTRLRLVEPSR